jgi:hypothetical protein
MILRGSFPDYFNTTAKPAIDKRLNKALRTKMRAAVMPRIFQQLSSSREIEQSVGHTGVGQFRKIVEGAAVTSDQPRPIPSKTFVMERFGLSIIVTRDLIEDDRFNIVADRAVHLANSELDTREMQAASVINDGFTVNGYDGVPLFSASHPKHYQGGVQSNLLTVGMALSHTALEEATIQMYSMVDDTGKPVSFTPDMLVVPPSLMYKAPEILRSQMRSDTANNATNALNVMEGGLPQTIVWRYLTSATAWFLMSRENGLAWYNRRAPYTQTWTDEPTESGHYARRYRCAFGHSLYFGAFASNPS